MVGQKLVWRGKSEEGNQKCNLALPGNQALDSGLVGIGLGALGATVLAPAGGLLLC